MGHQRRTTEVVLGRCIHNVSGKSSSHCAISADIEVASSLWDVSVLNVIRAAAGWRSWVDNRESTVST
jgi:hypothetical protein